MCCRVVGASYLLRVCAVDTDQGSIYATFLHDVVYLYAVIVDEMIKNGLHVVYLYAVIVDEMIKNGLHVVYLYAVIVDEMIKNGLDVVNLYAVIVDEMIKNGLDYRNGTDVMHRAKNFQFDGNSASFTVGHLHD